MKRPARPSHPCQGQGSFFERSGKLFLIVVFGAGMVIIGGLKHLLGTSRQYQSVTRTVEKWKPIYGLDEKQADAIRDIELKFHGSGSPFSIRVKRTTDEIAEHHKRVSEVMTPESGARFLADMKRERH